MLGPGSTITHAAVRALADSGCLIQWVGEEGVRVYGVGLGETRSSRNLLRQAAAWANPATRLSVVRRMYACRFGEPVDESFSLQQLRGREGIRVRSTYQEASKATGVEWKGRDYNRSDWKSADPVNRALSCANSCLYGICHAAIVAAGYSPAIGFIHTGKALSFVYDIADLYKTGTSIPAAFVAASAASGDLEGTVRRAMRDLFMEEGLLERILPDLAYLFEDVGLGLDASLDSLLDAEDALPSGLWDPVDGRVEGGVNYSEDPNGSHDPGTGAGQPEG
jgi:CRISPR-associated protein Cas1